MHLRAVILFSLCVSFPVFAGEGSVAEKYVPLFEVDVAYDPGTVTDDYMNAYRSPTQDIAIQKWEAFLSEHVQSEPATIDDMTDLTLIRQAHYELMRLYYLSGRAADADELLKKANDLVVYSSPEPGEAKRWCRRYGYCK